MKGNRSIKRCRKLCTFE